MVSEPRRMTRVYEYLVTCVTYNVVSVATMPARDGAAGRLVRGAAAEGGFTTPDALAAVARVAVWEFAILIAVNQVGVADTLVNTLFMGVVAMLALGGGLAFGLGGRDVAARVWENWYGQVQRAKPKLERAAQAGRERAQQAPRQWEEMPTRVERRRADEPRRTE